MGASIFVATNGTEGATGTIGDPLSFGKAIGATSPAQAGDTVWVRGGTYTNVACNLSGTSNSPIILRNYASERVIIDTTNQFAINGSGTWVWGFEFSDSTTNRDILRTSGIGLNTGVAGRDNKLINCIIHDTGNAVFVSYQSTNAEVAGCVIYNNGYILPDRRHGHGLYVQNRSYTDQPTYQHNLLLNNFSKGVNCRSSSKVVNTRFYKNVLSGNEANWHIESDDEMSDLIFLDGNLCYYAAPGYEAFYPLRSDSAWTISMSNNVFANAHSQVLWWTNIIFNANTQFYSFQARATPTVAADWNRYYKVQFSAPVAYNSTNVTLAQWQAMGNDANGTVSANNPTENWVYVIQNPYDGTRNHVVVYNWGSSNTVSFTPVLPTGYSFEVRNAQDYFSGALASGVYSGGTITVPMTNLSIADPIGSVAITNTSPVFAAFVLLGTQPTLPTLRSTTVRATTLRTR